MRPHLVRINSTIVELAPFAFNSILLVEIVLCTVIITVSPLFCVAVCRVGAIHRNFRCQMCLASLVYSFGICARFVLIYYQIYDVPLTDNDPVLLAADLLRDTVIGYYSGLTAAFFSQTLVATYYWKWYEKHSFATLSILFVTETVNFALSFTNAAIWLLGITPFIINISYLAIVLSCSVSGFFYTYTKNAHHLDSLTKTKISHVNYTVGRSFQIRENIFLMKYILRFLVPSAIISSPCFLCFAFNAYGPEDWLLSRSIAYAVWDLFFAIFRVCYLHREITKHPLIWREFRNLGIIQIFRRRRMSRVEEASSVIPKMDIATTQTYFDQFKEAWK